MKKIIACLATAVLMTQMSVFPVNALAYDNNSDTIIISESEKLTDIDQISDILSAYIAENGLDAKIVSDENYPQYAGTVVIEFNTATSANTTIIEYAEKSNIERTLFNLVPCVEGAPITTFNPDEDIITTTTTAIVAEKINDIDQISNILNAYIADNGLDAKIVSDENYPQYVGTVVIEFNSATSANTMIIEYAEKSNIERTLFNLVPCAEGAPITTFNPDEDIITTTTTAIVAEKITDIEQISNLLNAYIADNKLDAKIVSDENYPQYAGTVVIEFNTATSANTTIIEYAEKSNIERTLFNLVPCAEGELITTFNPDAEITTTTTTSTITNGDNNITTLPQTGYSDIYLKIVVVAVLMTICGTMLIVKSRKETE